MYDTSKNKTEQRKQVRLLPQLSNKSQYASYSLNIIPGHFLLFPRFLIPRVVCDSIHTSCPCTFLNREKNAKLKPNQAVATFPASDKWELEHLLASMLSNAFVTPWRASKKSSLYISYQLKNNYFPLVRVGLKKLHV